MSDSASRPSRTLEIAHVLFTDIVGYSKLPMDEQEQLLMQLQEAVRQTSEFLRAEAADELIRLPTGDGMALVFFRDAEAPVRCALELSRILNDYPSVQLRMGIHSGPVYRVADINANRNVAGGGINIAQRVMDCGDAGHILVSREVAEVIGQLSGGRPMLHDLGEVEVKHGVRIHIYNLYDNEAGNPALSKKLAASKAAAVAPEKPAQEPARPRWMVPAGAAILVIGLAVAGWLLFSPKVHALTDKDTIVIADFTNTTGDTVFDSTLRQGLSVQLEQSPFLSVISDQKIQQTLQMMGQKPDAKLTPEIARELCQRTESTAVLDGSIASLGSQYVLGLKAVNCRSGDFLAQQQVTAVGKEQILKALGEAATKLREKLGESLSTVHKFDTPLEQATTTSLEALQAYSLGVMTDQRMVDPDAATPFFQRAINLDPNFAMAHAALFDTYAHRRDDELGFEEIRKAFELREGVSERERFIIESLYDTAATGDLEKDKDTVEVWAQTFPRDPAPRNRLAIIYETFGQYDKALSEMLEARRLSPETGLEYCNLIDVYLSLNRLEEARTTGEEAKAKKFDFNCLHNGLYVLAFLKNDTAGMALQVSWGADKSVPDGELLSMSSDTAAYFGRLREARELSRRAIASAEGDKGKQTGVARKHASDAVREALFGNATEARQHAAIALELSNESEAQYAAAISLVRVGDVSRAHALTEDWGKRFPENTIVRFSFLPTLRAQLALSRNDVSTAIKSLQTTTPYELGDVGFTNLYPVFVRGEAYLASHKGSEAAAEFQKILDHRGIVFNGPIGALAHLGLGRAYVLEGDTAKARAAYQDFLTLWKDADPDIPILIVAKSEYVKLK